MATIRLCSRFTIADIDYGPFPFKSVDAGGASEKVDVSYDPLTHNWDEKKHLSFAHAWRKAGSYNIQGTAQGKCLDEPFGTSIRYPNFPAVQITASVNVSFSAPPLPPHVLPDYAGKKLTPGTKYSPFAQLTLETPVPPSGSMIKISTDRRGEVDVETAYGSTLNSGSTFAFIPPPGSDNGIAIMNLIVADGAPAGPAVISFRCVGTYEETSHCYGYERHPLSITVQVGPGGKK